MYSITTNSSRSLVELTFSGPMDQDPAAFFKELTGSADRVRRSTGSWQLLVDFTETDVMVQERAQNTGKIFEWCLANGISKTAIVASSATQKMQIRRVTNASKVIEFFDTAAQAKAWLKR